MSAPCTYDTEFANHPPSSATSVSDVSYVGDVDDVDAVTLVSYQVDPTSDVSSEAYVSMATRYDVQNLAAFKSSFRTSQKFCPGKAAVFVRK